VKNKQKTKKKKCSVINEQKMGKTKQKSGRTEQKSVKTE
jgi:hypothetical protein